MRIAVAVLTVWVSLIGAADAVAQDKARAQVNIPAQGLVSALKTFAREHKIQLVFRSEVIANLTTDGVSGTMTTDEALTRLLAGTPLTYKYLDEKTVTIVPATDGVGKSTASDLNPADQMRLALADAQKLPHSSAEESESSKNQVTVEGQRERPKPFKDGSMDIPRTVDDVQPYYIFDAKTLEQSGALNLDDFLKQRLTMNAVALSNSQIGGSSSTLGNTSSFNLRGLGTDKTLILINGRRSAGVQVFNTNVGGYDSRQPDLNAIPLVAIERVEILPTSASGIYGGSAIGGVINVILKKTYTGGEFRVGYDNTLDVNSARRSLSASYGLQLQEGKTQLSMNAAWSDARPMIMRDRRELLDRGLQTILRNSPSFIYTPTNPFLGSVPNIFRADGPANAPLMFKDGTSLGSRFTHISAGTSPSISSPDLNASLMANAGTWDLVPPESTQYPTGLLRPLSVTPESNSLHVSMRRSFLGRYEAFVDFSRGENNSTSIYNPAGSFSNVPVSAPSNPFNSRVFVRWPSGVAVPLDTSSVSQGFTVGLLANLPWGWEGEFDYSFSESRYQYEYYQADFAAHAAALVSGEFDPFVDTLRYPLDVMKYVQKENYDGSARLHDIALRGSGPALSISWWKPMATFGVESRRGVIPENTRDYVAKNPDANSRTTYFKQEQVTDSLYGELFVPLVKQDHFPMLHALELQLAGRVERYTVDSGTPSVFTLYNQDPPYVEYSSPTLNGEPFRAKSSYSTTSDTFGLRYQPVEELTVRLSRSTAFLPPLPAELLASPAPNDYFDYVTDPQNPTAGTDYGDGILYNEIQTISGGNPTLKPQNSLSWNAGIIWQPSWQALKGLRFNAEYYRIEQFDAISGLTAQQVVDNEDVYSDRVVRDSGGLITLVDTSLLNLYHRETEGWDLSVDYRRDTGNGVLVFRAAESIVQHLKNQITVAAPELDSVHFPSEGGAAKYKSNVTLGWERGAWAASWTARYFGSYKQYGAGGGASGVFTNYTRAQGSSIIPSQTYHDLFASFSFDKGGIVDGTRVQLGVRNVFGSVPPLDMYFGLQNFYLSPYGDTRLRSYWLNISKQL